MAVGDGLGFTRFLESGEQTLPAFLEAFQHIVVRHAQEADAPVVFENFLPVRVAPLYVRLVMDASIHFNRKAEAGAVKVSVERPTDGLPPEVDAAPVVTHHLPHRPLPRRLLPPRLPRHLQAHNRLSLPLSHASP